MVLLSKDKFMICLRAKTNKKSISNTKDKELEKEKEKHMLAFYMLESNEKKKKDFVACSPQKSHT